MSKLPQVKKKRTKFEKLWHGLPESSKLSPTELVLDELYKRVQIDYPKSMSELFQKYVWESLPYRFFQKLFEWQNL